MRRSGMHAMLLCAGSLAACTIAATAPAATGATGDVARGEYLVNLGGCNDCHSPKMMTAQGPMPDPALLLSGHRAGVKVPDVPPGVLGPQGWGALTTNELTAWAGPWGISYAANLTPDKTGIGAWTPDQFINTMHTGKHLGVGRPILPPMPWQYIGKLTDRDLRAIFAYLKTLKPVDNVVPAPTPPK